MIMKGHRLEVADVPSSRSVPFLNSCILLDDADLDHTVAMALLGRFENNGQSCIASKRFIVVEH
jgi:hypothetical protein